MRRDSAAGNKLCTDYKVEGLCSHHTNLHCLISGLLDERKIYFYFVNQLFFSL